MEQWLIPGVVAFTYGGPINIAGEEAKIRNRNVVRENASWVGMPGHAHEEFEGVPRRALRALARRQRGGGVPERPAVHGPVTLIILRAKRVGNDFVPHPLLFLKSGAEPAAYARASAAVAETEAAPRPE